MLDDVAVRPVLEQPAGKNAPPLRRPVLEHDQLDKRTRFLRHFPLGGALARADAHDGATNANAFAGFQADIAHQPVALVEQAEHRHTLWHWRDAGIHVIGGPCGSRRGFGNGPVILRRRGLVCHAITAGQQRRKGDCHRSELPDCACRFHRTVPHQPASGAQAR